MAVRAASLPSPLFFVEEFRRQSLKQELLTLLDGCERGLNNSVATNEKVNQIIDDLAELNPTDVAATKLSGRWSLLWTTEKETLSLAAGGFFGRAVTDVYQIIDTKAGTLSNNIEFEGGAFEVDSTCEPSNGIRVSFEFNAAKIRFEGLTVPLPPVGKGWFDCVYLDDQIRIVRDSRNDSLIASRT